MNHPIETRLLRYFLAVAEELHVGRAATRLHISQPPLSRQIQALERRLGTPLFRREGRRMVLTPAGAAFRRDAEHVLASLEQAERNARLVARGARGRLRIGFVSTVLYSVLPKLIRDFRRDHPDIELALEELTARAQLEAFDAGEIDVGFMICPSPQDGIELVEVLEEPLVLCMPEDHVLARSTGPVDLDAAAGEPFVMFPRPLSPGLYDRIVGFAERAGFALRVGQEAVQMQTIVGLVTAGVGLAIVPACMRTLRRPGVSYRPFTSNAPTVSTALVHSRRAENPLVDTFVAHASAHAAQRTDAAASSRTPEARPRRTL